jgi:hypothetical protein
MSTAYTEDGLYSMFITDVNKKDDVLELAAMHLTAESQKNLENRIAKKEKKMKDRATPGTTDTGEEPVQKEEVSKKALEEFWNEIESADVSTLVSQDVIDDFQYVGFDPDKVASEILLRGIKKGKDIPAILKDMVDMVTVAVIKGSITEKNMKRMSDKGKVTYAKYKDLYDLKDGGSKGMTSEHITIARIAAAVPAMVLDVLLNRPKLAKLFSGGFGASKLPYYLRHQAAAACIPEDLPERLKEYLLTLITAYTSDQSKSISESKEKVEDIFPKQMNFVMTTHGSHHPSEKKRKLIFKRFTLESDFEKLSVVATRIKKLIPEFVPLTQDQIAEDLANLS